MKKIPKKRPGGQEKKKIREKKMRDEVAVAMHLKNISQFFPKSTPSSSTSASAPMKTTPATTTQINEVDESFVRETSGPVVDGEKALQVTEDENEKNVKDLQEAQTQQAPSALEAGFVLTESEENSAILEASEAVSAVDKECACGQSNLTEIIENETHTASPTSSQINSSFENSDNPCNDGSDIVSTHDFFVSRASSKLQLNAFLDFHTKNHAQIPDSVKLRSDKSERMYLSYNNNTDSFHCNVCLAFCDEKDKSRFVVGSKNDVKHNRTRFDEHERSKTHNNYLEALILHERQSDVGYLIAKNLVQKANQEILDRREVLVRIVEIARLIGKRGLSYRGDKHESASSLNDENLDHGNFLELTLLLAQFDPIMKNHIEKVKANGTSTTEKKTRGRGDKVTFMSKTTFNYIFEVFHEIMMEIISEEVNKAGMFSIQIDSSQDITVKEQVSVVLRYVLDGKVYETFAGFVESHNTSGKEMFKLVQDYLHKYKIDLKWCVASATDGASNMRGQYSGFQSYLASVSTNQVYVWCTSHILNLVMSEICNNNLSVIKLFESLSESAKLVKYSYKRSNLFLGFLDKACMKRLSIIAKTRWWSTEKALTNVFGPIGRPEEGLYIPLMLVLEALSESTSVDAGTRSKASGLLENLTKFSCVLTASLFQHIFKITTPLSKYLQTKGLDILKAVQMVTVAQQELFKLSESSEKVVNQAKSFVSFANLQFSEKDSNLELTEEFPKVRGRRRKRFFDEEHESAYSEIEDVDPILKFKIDVIDPSIKLTTELLQKRFLNHQKLATDLHFLDPANFELLSDLPSNAFDSLCSKLSSYCNNFKANEFVAELENFALNWPKFKQDVHQLYKTDSHDDCFSSYTFSEDEDGLDDNSMSNSDFEECKIDSFPENVKCQSKCQSSEGCALCVFTLLEKYKLYSLSYANLYLAYKYILTISIGQVECERSFSKMKYIKNRLRSSMSETNFVNLTLMFCEKRLLPKISNHDVINRLSQRSQKLNKLLTLK